MALFLLLVLVVKVLLDWGRVVLFVFFFFFLFFFSKTLVCVFSSTRLSTGSYTEFNVSIFILSI